jgi:class 3 adenylate cyclase/tetratricopeptide (TPR) repeat protein
VASCPACGRENREGARFCAGCGREQLAGCPSCRAPLAAGARFCDRCGAPAPGDGAAAGARATGDYTPKHLAERILRARAALEGERKHVTVLFADVKGSVELAAGVDPEDWHQVMNRFFEIIARGVHRYEGTVNQYTGDGAMALFGAPIAHEDHAQRACGAALVLRDELERFAEELKRTRGLGFSTRLGLNSGEVVVGKIGDDLRMDYTAQGHTVSLAARMEQLAAPGNAYLTENTARLVRGFFELRDLGEFDLKGVPEALRVYELGGPGALRTRLDRSRARGLSRFVSRGPESERLDAALAADEDGLRVQGLSGEGGVGKSRLCLEFVERCRAAGRTVVETHVPSHARSVPLLPWQTLFRDLLGHDEADDPETARERIAGRLLRVVPGSLEALPVLYDFLGVPDPGETEQDPERRHDLLLELLVEVLRARSREGAPILLFEDLHWIDDASNGMLARLIDALADVPLLLVVNFRPGYRASWMLRGSYDEIELAPLGEAASRELLDELLGSDPSVTELAEGLVDRTGGNPFFIEEVVLSLIESGRLVGERGAYVAPGPLGPLEVPPTVHTVLAARIDRLSEPAKQVVQAAAVIGKRFAELLLRRVARLPETACASALDELCASELIYAETLHPFAEYAFRHPLTQEVAYRTQLGDARRQLHANVAQEIARLGKRHADERAAVIAHHLERGELSLEAARWHRIAAERTRFIDAPASVFHWQRVRALARDDSPESLELRVRACWSALDVGARAALPMEDARVLFDDGVQLAERLAEPTPSLVLLHEAYSARLAWSGDPEGERQHLAEAARLVDGVSDVGLKLLVLYRGFVAEFHRGDFREALALSSRGVELAEGDPDADAFHHREQLLSKANALMHLGDLDGCAALLGRADEVVDRLGSARYGSRTMHSRALIGANLALFRGDRRESLRLAQDFVSLAARTGSAWGHIVSTAALGRALLLNEEWDAARRELEESLRLAREQQIGLESEAATLAYLAEALLGARDGEGARATAEEAVALAERRGSRFWELTARLALARCAPGDDAHAALRRAEVLLDETGGEVLRAQVEQLLGES